MRRHERAGLLAAIRVTRCLLPRTVEPAVCASEANTPSIFAVAAHLERSGILEVHREQRGPKQDEADGPATMFCTRLSAFSSASWMIG